jgi:glycosyltransferase involved in cell wall biosynthesis
VDVGIVVPCFNVAPYLAETVESVLIQTGVQWHLVIVDDGSTDSTGSIAASYARGDARITCVTSPNRGVGQARNLGYVHLPVPPEFVMFLDGDDVLEPTMLRRAVGYLRSHENVGVVYALPLIIDARGDLIGDARAHGFAPRLVPAGPLRVRELGPNEPDTPFSAILGLTGIIPSSAMMRTSVFEEAGKWDAAFGQPMEDTDLLLRMALLAQVHCTPQPWVRHRRRSGQSTGDEERMWAQVDKLRARWRAVRGLSTEQAQTVEAAWRFIDRTGTAVAGLQAAVHHLRRLELIPAIRFAGGSVRRVGRSYARPVRVPPREDAVESSIGDALGVVTGIDDAPR